jgi:hypothetical protein
MNLSLKKEDSGDSYLALKNMANCQSSFINSID